MDLVLKVKNLVLVLSKKIKITLVLVRAICVVLCDIQEFH